MSRRTRRKVLVAGDRNWSDQGKVDRNLDKIGRWYDDVEVIEGEAKGADRAGRAWATKRGHLTRRFPADWKRFGRAAGPIRNKQMLAEGKPDAVLAFHSNISRSKGTKNMLNQASAAGVPTAVVKSMKWPT